MHEDWGSHENFWNIINRNWNFETRWIISGDCYMRGNASTLSSDHCKRWQFLDDYQDGQLAGAVNNSPWWQITIKWGETSHLIMHDSIVLISDNFMILSFLIFITLIFFGHIQLSNCTGGEDPVQAQCWHICYGHASNWQTLFYCGQGLSTFLAISTCDGTL